MIATSRNRIPTIQWRVQKQAPEARKISVAAISIHRAVGVGARGVTARIACLGNVQRLRCGQHVGMNLRGHLEHLEALLRGLCRATGKKEHYCDEDRLHGNLLTVCEQVTPVQTLDVNRVRVIL